MDFSARAATKDVARSRRRRSCTPPRSASTLPVTPWKFRVEGEAGSESDERTGAGLGWPGDRGGGEGDAAAVHGGVQTEDPLSANMSETVTPWKFRVEGEAGSENDERTGAGLGWPGDRGGGQGDAATVHGGVQAEDRPGGRRL